MLNIIERKMLEMVCWVVAGLGVWLIAGIPFFLLWHQLGFKPAARQDDWIFTLPVAGLLAWGLLMRPVRVLRAIWRARRSCLCGDLDHCSLVLRGLVLSYFGGAVQKKKP